MSLLHRTHPDDASDWVGATEDWSPIAEFSSTEEIDTTFVILRLILDDYRSAAFAAIDKAVEELSSNG